MPQIPLFGLGVSAKSPVVTAKLLQNLYAEIRPDGEKSKIVAYGTPGLTLFADLGDTPCRGGLEFPANNVAYVVHRGTLWEVNNAGVMTNRGSLATTTGRVSMEHNGVQVAIADGTNLYIYNTSTTAFATVASALFANPTTVTYLARRFVCSFSGSSRFQWSAVDDGTSWDALDFANAETNPDPIVRVYASNGQLVLLGTETTEFWGITGVSSPAFSLIQGTATEWGLAAPWSISKYDNTFASVFTNRMGEVMIGKMDGYVPSKISTVDIDDLINNGPTADGSSYSYMLGGHPMFVINFSTQGETWLFDGSTGIWSPLKSLGLGRHRAEFAFNLVGATIVADYALGRLYRLDKDVYTDNGDPIARQITGETIVNPDGPLDIDKLRIDMEVGVGLAVGQGSNPQIGLEVSRDNARTWGPQQLTTIGAAGQYATRVEWRRLGTVGVPRAPAFTPRITITDPVPCVFVSACLNPET